jgi:hypothetical protein
MGSVAGWGRKVLLGSLLGTALGVLVGLLVGRILWPGVEPASVPSAPPMEVPQAIAMSLPAPAPNGSAGEGIVVISALYALDGDVARARERLVALGIEDPAGAVADLARSQVAAGQERLAAELATLAVALGSREAALVAYAFTATPASTPTALPTETPAPSMTATFPPSPTASSTPSPSPEPTRTRTPLPPTAQPPLPVASPTPTTLGPVATPLPLRWDRRVDLLDSPVRLVEAEVAPGQAYWRLVRLEWWRPGEGGNTLMYVTTLNENGQPVWGQEVVVENGGHTPLYTQPKPGEPYGTNFAMGSTLNSYQVFVGGNLPSDRVTGLGLGEWLGGKDHTTFVLVFQRGRK